MLTNRRESPKIYVSTSPPHMKS